MPELQIIFRKIPKSAWPRYWKKQAHWHVTAWGVEEGESFPMGEAWVYVPLKDAEHVGALPPIVDYIQVADVYRRKGIGEKLLAACFAHWPQLVLTKAIGTAGAGLIAKVTKGEPGQ